MADVELDLEVTGQALEDELSRYMDEIPANMEQAKHTFKPQ